MSNSIQSVNYSDEIVPETSVSGVRSVSYESHEASSEKEHNRINYVSIQSEESECENTLFFYL